MSYKEMLLAYSQKPLSTRGDNWTYEECPHCNSSSRDKPSFKISRKNGKSYCFRCGTGSHIERLLNYTQPFELRSRVSEHQLTEEVKDNSRIKELFYSSRGIDFTKQQYDLFDPNLSARTYLNKTRGFDNSILKLLNNLKSNEQNGKGELLVFPFFNQNKDIVAVHRYYLKNYSDHHLFWKVDKKYLGSKSEGVAIIREGHSLIISEGLETGLAVLQNLGPDYGLIVAGDKFGLRNLADKHLWALQDAKKVLIAADNDLDGGGQECAIYLHEKTKDKSEIYIPKNSGQDWDDVSKNNNFFNEWRAL